MNDVFVALLFGYGAVLVSLLVSVIGVFKEKFWLVILGAVLFIPFAYYLSGGPGTGGFPILLPLFQMGSAAAVREKNKLWAWLLLIPAFLASLWVLGLAWFVKFGAT